MVNISLYQHLHRALSPDVSPTVSVIFVLNGAGVCIFWEFQVLDCKIQKFEGTEPASLDNLWALFDLNEPQKRSPQYLRDQWQSLERSVASWSEAIQQPLFSNCISVWSSESVKSFLLQCSSSLIKGQNMADLLKPNSYEVVLEEHHFEDTNSMDGRFVTSN